MITTALDPWNRTVVVDLPECEVCGRDVPSGQVSLIGYSAFCAGKCDVIAAAGVASSVAAGGDEAIRDVQAAAEILHRAAHALDARVGGRVTR